MTGKVSVSDTFGECGGGKVLGERVDWAGEAAGAGVRARGAVQGNHGFAFKTAGELARKNTFEACGAGFGLAVWLEGEMEHVITGVAGEGFVNVLGGCEGDLIFETFERIGGNVFTGTNDVVSGGISDFGNALLGEGRRDVRDRGHLRRARGDVFTYNYRNPKRRRV
jgi:hypothetical protein